MVEIGNQCGTLKTTGFQQVKQSIVRNLIGCAAISLVLGGAWAAGISVGDTYFYTDGDDSGGNKEHALYRESVVSYDDAYENKCVAVPVYGATSVTEIIPRFAFGTAVESDFAWVEVVPDQVLFEKVAKPVWSKKENWGNRWGVDTSNLWYEWDKDIWPTGRVQDGRFWIVAAHDSSNVPQLQKNSSRLGVATFCITAVGAENWSNSAMFIREPPAGLINKNEIGVYLRGISFERDPNKQMFGYTINGTAIHGFGIRDALDDGSLFKTETTLVLDLAEAGTLVLSAPAEDDEDNLNRISKTQLKISGGNIISDSEDYFARTNDDPLRTGWDHRRIVKVSSETKLTLKNYSWCMSFQDMAFYPNACQSVNIRASFFTPTQRSVAYQCGVVYGTGVYKAGEMAELTALPGEGETFDHWEMSDGGKLPDGVDPQSPIMRFAVTKDMCGSADDFRTMTLKVCWVEHELEVDLKSASIHDYEKLSSYGPFIPGTKVEVDTGLVGYAAKGLPSGLKLNKKTGVISGTPKKPGTYDVTFTKKGEETVTMTFVVDPFPTISIAMEGDTEKCKVTGASKPGKGYSVGKKVNLAAKAPKGTAFVGWFMDGEPWPDEATYLAAKQKYVMTGESLSLVARFEREKMSVSCPGLSSPLAVGSAVSIPIAIETQSGVKSVKGSKLPSGLKVKKVGDGWAIVGTPKKAGTYNAKVKVTAKSGAVEEVVISVVVE